MGFSKMTILDLSHIKYGGKRDFKLVFEIARQMRFGEDAAW